MKKRIILSFITIIIFLNAWSYASSSFDYMIEIMEIKKESRNGYLLNEEIYEAYNQFVYGSPIDVNTGQRWKDVTNGKWTKQGGKWNGSGIRGEYWILGFDINGDPIHNHQFPADIEPPTPPTVWRYVELENAESSWSDTKKYIYEEQRQYMLTQPLTRNNIQYDLTAFDIGLTKARAENYATWKTAGNIYTRRYDQSNKEWAANFIVPPMAADAKLQANITFKNGDQYILKEGEESIFIPIEFGCHVVELNAFAKEEHIKLIQSELIIPNRQSEKVENTKATQVEKEVVIEIARNDYKGQSVIELEIKNQSLLLTDFTVDGALTDVITKKIVIYVENVEEKTKEINIIDVNNIFDKESPPPRIDKIEIGRYTKTGIEKLKINKKTNTQFICAGHILQFQIHTSNYVNDISIEFEGDSSICTFDSLTKKFEWDEPRERKEKTRFSTLKRMKQSFEQPIVLKPYQSTSEGEADFQCQYLIPYGTKQTIHSWSTLRELSQNTFQIDETRILERIRTPYHIKIRAYGENGIITRQVNLDILERWDTLYNRDLTPYIK